MNLNEIDINGINFVEYVRAPSTAKLNLIVGKNGVGKTRLLEAVVDVVGYHPKGGCEFIDDHSFGSEEMEELGAEWNSIGRTFPNVRGAILKILRIIEPDFVDVEYNKEDYQVVVEVGSQKERILMADMSSGFKRAFEIGVRAWVGEDAVILIDNAEAGLHHSVQEALWLYLVKVVKERNNKLFATTHSGDTILVFAKASVEDSDVDGLLIRLGYSDRNTDKGKLIATTFNEKQLHDIHTLGIDARG